MKLQTKDFGPQDAKPIVMIHGWGISSCVFFPIVNKLAEHYKIMLLDLPGYGMNVKVPSNRATGIVECLEDTIPDGAVILGWSLGGMIALRYLITNCEKISGLITICSSPKFVADTEKNWPGTEKSLLEKFISVLTQENYLQVLNKFLSLQAMGSIKMRSDIKELKTLLNGEPIPSYYELLSGLKTLIDEDLRGYLSRIECPSLHIYGAKDRLVPATGYNIWPLRNDMEIKVFSQSAHTPFITETEEFNNTLQKFMEKFFPY